MSRSLRLILLAGVLHGLGAPARAEPAAAAAPADQARQHYTRSKELYAQGDLNGALAEMLKAYQLAPSPVLAFNLGKLHEQAGKPEDAITYYERYLKESPAASDRAMVEATVKRLRAQAAKNPGAKPAPAAKGSPEERAKESFKKGRELYRDGDYQGALAQLTQAYELVPSASLVYNMAKAREKLSDDAGALKDYQKYLEMEPNAPDRKDVETLIRALEKRLREAFNELSLESTPTGADIYLDGAEKLAGQTPLTVRLAPGQHGLKVVKNGFEVATRDFLMPDDRPLTLTFELRPLENVGFLTVESDTDGAQIFLDGNILALTPLKERHAVPAGRHQLVLEREGYKRSNQLIEVVKDKETHARVNLESTAGRSKVPLFLAPALGLPLVTVAAVGVVISVVLGVKASLSIAQSPAWIRNFLGFSGGLGVAAVLGLLGLVVPVALIATWVGIGFIPHRSGDVKVLPGPVNAAPAPAAPSQPAQVERQPAAPAAPPAPAAAEPAQPPASGGTKP